MKWCNCPLLPAALRGAQVQHCPGGRWGMPRMVCLGTVQALLAASFPVNKNVLSSTQSLKFGAFKRCAWHMEASTAPFLLFGETNLADEKCARWTSFAWRNLQSSSLCWCHKQLKAEPSKKITHSQIYFFISASPVIIPLSFPFLQHKLLWNLPFYSHQVRCLNCFLRKGQLCGSIWVGDSLWYRDVHKKSL